MKRTLLLTALLIILSWKAQAQFKTIQGQFSKESNQEELRIFNAPELRSKTWSRNHRPLVPKAMNEINLLAAFHPEVKVELAGPNHSYAVAADVDYASIGREDLHGRTRAYMYALKSLIPIREVDEEYTIVDLQVDELRMSHLKLQQIYNGIEVFGGEIILHGYELDFDFMNGRIFPSPTISTQPTLSADDSEKILRQNTKVVEYRDDHPLAVFDFEKLKTSLVILPLENGPVLCYHHSVYTSLMDRWEYFIDAHSGEVVKKYESICRFHHHEKGQKDSRDPMLEHDLQGIEDMMDGPEKANAIDLLGVSRTLDTYSVGSSFYMIDASREMFNSNSSMPNDPIGAIWTIDAFNTSPQNNNFDYDHVKSGNNSWNDRGSVSAHFNGSRAYLYFRNLHSRYSINGSGGNIVSLVNVADEGGNSMGNAFWNGAAIFYGNGDASFKPLAAGLDVAGHEMSHGVIQNTANLEYQGESGALNESFADVFGAMIDRDDWLIGEDVVKPGAFPGGALRSMSNPANGASTGDFGSGWQPSKYSERYTGSQDNGGVHINSGIPNHAFFLFASDNRLGSTDNDRKIKAEKVYYRALAQYLTKSSQFVDCRIAVVRAAEDLYGANVAQAAREAFDRVEIFGGNGGNYQNDAEVNPGDDLILITTANQQGLYIFTPDGQEIANPLSTTNVISKPSVTDAGDVIVFVGDDESIHYLTIDWSQGSVNEQVLNTGTSRWRNAVISKDGTLLAALRAQLDNEVVVFDLFSGNGVAYELKNPTFTTGVSTGDVLLADALEFDYSGEYLMYDAQNRIQSSTAGAIEFWDIGFIKVWNKAGNTFALPDQIEKLFQGLPEGVSIGNPTFSKNSNYVIAFDFIDELQDVSILGANIETGDIGLIFENSGLAYPSYSRTDEQLIFDNPGFSSIDLGIADLDANKISSSTQPFLYGSDFRWGVWFSNGIRNFTAVSDLNQTSAELKVSPNPVNANSAVYFESPSSGYADLRLVDVVGRMLSTNRVDLQSGMNRIEMDFNGLPKGTYFVELIHNGERARVQLVKI